jgi:hypothetical protein
MQIKAKERREREWELERRHTRDDEEMSACVYADEKNLTEGKD